MLLLVITKFIGVSQYSTHSLDQYLPQTPIHCYISLSKDFLSHPRRNPDLKFFRTSCNSLSLMCNRVVRHLSGKVKSRQWSSLNVASKLEAYKNYTCMQVCVQCLLQGLYPRKRCLPLNSQMSEYSTHSLDQYV